MIVKCIFLLTISLQFLGCYTLCEFNKKCGDCIRDSNACEWCSMDNFISPRCRSVNDTTGSKCDALQIVNPTSYTNQMESRNFSSDRGNVTQIKPQRIKISLRPGQSVNFEFSFKGAMNYPADIYFLFDVSKSMLPVLKTAAEASEKIYRGMLTKTNDVFLGIGTFIDKNALPFVTELNSSSTYSFKHQLKLTNNYTEFNDVLNSTKTGINYDNPESGLDALAQVIICNETIGWRKESRKIVILLTDDLYHAAGDGKWAGIVQPYDGECYTDGNGTYTKELSMDYPSLSVIRKLAAKEEVTILFGVKNEHRYTYEELSKYIKGSKTFLFKIQGKRVVFNNGQIYKALTDIYEELTRNIELKNSLTNEESKNIKLTFSPNCTSKNKIECNVNNDIEKTFQGTISLLEYKKKYDTSIIVDIGIVGIKEKLTLNIDVIKDCDCEVNISKFELNSTYCNRGGTKKCGICDCNTNRDGNWCECTKNENTGMEEDSSCRPAGAPSGSDLCSGHGTCYCGTCKCQKGFDGLHCQCNENSCSIKCLEHGKCVCGECQCRDGWKGKDCDCSPERCKIINGKDCNNRGICECGECQCDRKAKWDARIRQNKNCVVLECPDCHDNQCSRLKACALCHQGSTTNCDDLCNTIIVSANASLSDTQNMNKISTCEDISVSFGCYMQYKYQYDDDNYRIKLFVQKEKNCNISYYTYGGAVLAILILVGLVTVVAWKLLNDARDRLEYDRFVKQHGADASGPSDNPIYEPASTTFHNPAFRKASLRP